MGAGGYREPLSFCAVFCDSAAAVRIHPPSPEKSLQNRRSSTRFGYWISWWARVDVASRASKKAPLGLFCPPDCTAGRCRSNPPAFVSFTHIQNKKLQRSSYAEAFLVGAGGFEPPKLKSSRFTVCPHWPLGNTPRFCSRPCRTTRLFYQTKADLSTVFSHFFSFFF